MKGKTIILLLILYSGIFTGCRKFYQESGWHATPIPIRDKYGNYRAYLLYLPTNYESSNSLVIYYAGSDCSNTPDYFGNNPEDMVFFADYAEKYNFIFAVPYPEYTYTHMERTCTGWVIDKEIDFIEEMIDAVSTRIMPAPDPEIYDLGLSAGAFMAYYHAYLNNDRVKGVFSHGKGSEHLKEMIQDPSLIGWRLGLAHNRHDYPNIIQLMDEDYEYYMMAGIDVKIWKDCDDNRHSWSIEKTEEYLEYLFYGSQPAESKQKKLNKD